MANWMLTGMTKKAVEKATVILTKGGLEKLHACDEALLHLRSHQMLPVTVNEENVEQMIQHDILQWLLIIWENFIGKVDDKLNTGDRRIGDITLSALNSNLWAIHDEADRFWRASEDGHDPPSSRVYWTQARVKKLTMLVKAMIIAAMRLKKEYGIHV